MNNEVKEINQVVTKVRKIVLNYSKEIGGYDESMISRVVWENLAGLAHMQYEACRAERTARLTTEIYFYLVNKYGYRGLSN